MTFTDFEMSDLNGNFFWAGDQRHYARVVKLSMIEFDTVIKVKDKHLPTALPCPR